MEHKNFKGYIKIYEISASYGVVPSVSTHWYVAQEYLILIFLVYSITII
jgi:hypothetical protein